MLPMLRGLLEQDGRGRAAGSASAAAMSTGGRRAIAATPVRGTSGTSSASVSASTGSTRPASCAGQVRRQFRRHRLQRRRVDRDRLDQLGAEAQRVLERVKALDDGQLGIAPRVAEAHACVLIAAHRRHHDSAQSARRLRPAGRGRRPWPGRAPVGAAEQVLGRLGEVPAGEPGRAGLLHRRRLAQPLDDLRGLLERGVGQDDEELLAAEADDRVFAAQLTRPRRGRTRAGPRRRRGGRGCRCRP